MQVTVHNSLQVGADAGFLHGVGHLGPELPDRALVGHPAPHVDHLGQLLRQAGVADHLQYSTVQYSTVHYSTAQ